MVRTIPTNRPDQVPTMADKTKPVKIDILLFEQKFVKELLQHSIQFQPVYSVSSKNTLKCNDKIICSFIEYLFECF